MIRFVFFLILLFHNVFAVASSTKTEATKATKRLVSNTNKVNKYPRALSFEQFSSVLKFDRYERFEGQHELGTLLASNHESWESKVSSFWTQEKSTILHKELSSSSKNVENEAQQLHPFLLCHLDKTSTSGRQRYKIIKEEITKKENNSNFGFFMNELPVYNHNFDKDENQRQKQQGNDVENESDEEEIPYGACFYGSMSYLIANDIEGNNTFVTPMFTDIKIRRGASLMSNDENTDHERTIAVSIQLSPGIAKSQQQVMELAYTLLDIEKSVSEDSSLPSCIERSLLLTSMSVTVSSIDISSFTYEVDKSNNKQNIISNECVMYFIEYLAKQSQVLSVSPVFQTKMLNDIASWIIQGYPGENDSRPWFDAGITGEGEIVQLLDSGIDESSCYLKDASGEVPLTTSYDLTGGKIDLTKRKIVQYVALKAFNGDRSDGTSHGTHIAATIAGKRSDDGVTEIDGMVDGISPGVKLAFFDAHNPKNDTFLIPDDIQFLFYFGRQAGARIHSASWGVLENAEYSERVRLIDSYFYDDIDDEFIMFAAAGNNGTDGSSTIFDPSLAKNVISVGASHSHGDDLSNNMLNMEYIAAFSSRGPTADGRIKPDIVAPGHSILSAAANTNGCDPDERPKYEEQYQTSEGLMFMSGTSMSCPVAVGAGALVRQYFREVYDPSIDISGTLLKAVLVNGGEALVGRSKSVYGTDFDISTQYDEFQGFGRVNLMNSLKHPSPNIDSPDVHVEDARVLQQGQSHEYEFEICDSHEFRVTIVWKDPPNGAVGCQRCLVNDLDLKVLYDGKTYYPNGGTNRDSINNVERVIIDSSYISNSNQTVYVRVKASNLGSGEVQKYSLASTGCIKSDNLVSPTSSPTNSCGENEFEYVLEIFTDKAPEDTSWILEYQGSGGIIDVGRIGDYDKKLYSYIKKGCARYSCMLLTIRDSSFDGLCCKRGMGLYKISTGDIILAEGYSFGDRQEIKQFCYTKSITDEPTLSPNVKCNSDEFQYSIEITTDTRPDETRWELRKAKIDGVQRGFYTESNTKYMYSGLPIDYGCYEFIIHDDLGGLCCDAENGIDYNYECEERGKYKVMVGRFDDFGDYEIRAIASGSKFFEKESQKFCYFGCDDCEGISLFEKIGYTLSKSKSINKSRSPRITTSSYSTSTKSVSSSNMFTCAKNELKYDIIITTDDIPEQISWEFSYLNGTIIDSVKEGYYAEPTTEYPPRSYCLMPGCFNYTIYDSGGDGIYSLTSNPRVYEGYQIKVGDYTIIKGGDILEDYWYTETKLFCNFTEPIQPSNYEQQFNYEIILTTDNDPQNTWWELYPEEYIIDSVPFTTYTDQLTSYKHFGCAKKNSCYELLIFEHANDRSGLCCYFGSGSFSLSIGDEVLVKGDQFKDENYIIDFDSPIYYETRKFCDNNIPIVSSPSTFQETVCSDDQFEYTIEIRTDFFPVGLYWNFTYSNNGTSIESVEKGEYTIGYYKFVYQGCALFDCFSFSIKDDDGDGLCCSYGNGGYTVKTGDVTLAEGGQFSYSETKEFCYGPNITTYPSSQETDTPTQNPTPLLVCDENELKYDVIVTTDRFPQQTSWMLTYDDGTLIDSVEEGYYIEGSIEHKHSYCLSKGCFRYIIKDSGGDGICCGIDGNGKYEIKVGDQTLAGGGRFDDEDVREFCTPCEENEFKLDLFITTDRYPDNVSWELKEEDGSLIDSVQEEYYTDQNTQYVYSYCLPLGCYRYTIKDSWNNGISDAGGYEVIVENDVLVQGGGFNNEETTPFCYPGETNSPTIEPVVVALECIDASFFQYELTISTDYEPESTSWSFSYKYVNLNNIVSDPFSLTIKDSLSGYDSPNTDYIEYGCAKRDSCFEFQMYRGYFKLRDLDSRTVIAQSTERFTQSSFCHYNPLERAIVNIIIAVSTSPSDDDIDSMYTILTKSIQKILNQASSEIGLPYDDIVTKELSTSCYITEDEEIKCEVKFEVCNERCDVGGEVSLLSLVSQTLKQEIIQDGVFFYILKQTADYHDGIDIFENIESIEDIILGFDPDFRFGQPVNVPEEISTVSPTPMDPFFVTATQQIVQGISSTVGATMTFISGLFNEESNNDDGDDDGLFHFQIEIIADDNPSDMSWELRYDDDTIIDSIGTVVDASSFLNYENTGTDSISDSRMFVQLYKLNHECFKFTIRDHYSDGICCNYGYGSYTIISGDEILAKGGKFKSQETKRFCSNSDNNDKPTALQNTYLSNCDSFKSFKLRIVVNSGEASCNIGWKLYDSNGDMIDSVEKGDYTRDYTIYFHNYCLSDGCFYFEMFGGWIYDFASSSYQIYIDDSLVPLIQSNTEDRIFSIRSSAKFCHPSSVLNGAESVPVCNQHEKFNLQIAFTNERDVPMYDGLSWNLADRNGNVIDAVEVKNTKYIPYSNWAGTPVEIDGSYIHQNCVSEGCFTFTIEENFFRDKIISIVSTFLIYLIVLFCFCATSPVLPFSCLVLAFFLVIVGPSFFIDLLSESDSYFVGSYSISAGDIILLKGNSLDYFRQDTKQFCYEPSSISKCEGNEFKFQLDVTTDAWPHEIYWNLAHEVGSIVKNAGKRYYTEKNTKYTDIYCIQEGCYAFSIYDILGDGLCCSFGKGSYQININDGETVMEGSDFGYNETKEFCQETNNEDSTFFLSNIIDGLFGDNSCCETPAPAPVPDLVCDDHQFKYEVIVETDIAPRDTSWELSYDDGTVIDSVPCRQYTKWYNMYVHEGCIDLNRCFKYTIYDGAGNGILRDGGYTVIANDVIVAEGGGDEGFEDEETQTFCYPEESEIPSSDPTTTLSSQPTAT